MARIRTIKPEMPGSASLAMCSRDARLLFVWLITDADDQGRIAGSAKRLAGQLYPHDDDVTTAEIDTWLSELCDIGAVRSYFVGGARYLELVGWGDHQKIHKPTPSRLPAPPDNGGPRDPRGESTPHSDPTDDTPADRPREVREEPADDPRTARGALAPTCPSTPRPTACAPARIHGPRSTVEGSSPDVVQNADRSQVLPRTGSDPGSAQRSRPAWAKTRSAS